MTRGGSLSVSCLQIIELACREEMVRVQGRRDEVHAVELQLLVCSVVVNGVKVVIH